MKLVLPLLTLSTAQCFLATGFHSLHVLVGAAFLIVCLKRLNSFSFSFTHHFGFEAAA